VGNHCSPSNAVSSCLAYSLRTSVKETFRTNNLIVEKLDRFDSILREVNQERRLLLINLCNQRCTLLQLPSEIFTKILHEALELFDPKLWSFTALVNLASVCQFFARALRSSCFWPVLDASDSQSILRAVLTRNPKGPLVIKAKIKDTDEESATLLELASPHQQKWRAFSFKISNNSKERENLWTILARPTPLLVQLELIACRSLGALFPGLGPGCAISSLTLSHVSIPQGWDRLNGLRILNLTYGEDDTAPGLAELMKFIEGMAELRYLKLDLDFDGESLGTTFPPRKVIYLPHLASIIMSGLCWYYRFLVPQISSDSCSHYSYNESLDLSSFDLDIEVGFLHTLNSVVQGLHRLDIQYTSSESPTLRLLGSSSHRHPATDLDLYFDNSHRPTPSSWKKLALFLSSALNPAAQVRLSVQTRYEPSEHLSPDLLELIKDLDIIKSLRIYGTSKALDLLEAYCPQLSLSSNSHSRETLIRCQKLRHLSLDSQYIKGGSARKVARFIRSVIEIQDSSVVKSSMAVEKAYIGLRCSRSLYQLVAADLPPEWFSSGRILWTAPAPFQDENWVQWLPRRAGNP
jgi:hypothetical protein